MAKDGYVIHLLKHFSLFSTGAASIKYPCSLCKATFKTTRTRLSHMKKKHKLLLDTAADALPPRHQVKQGGPIITPISISQSTLIQVEPLGPLQQVNANIDTEQIRKLIESLENVQKVNQVVVLGQVPPRTPMLGLQLPGPGGQIYLNPTPPSMEHSNSVEMHHERDTCNFMDRTIILEPITPPNEGLEYPSFQELVSQRQSEVADLKLNHEETVILELTSALLPVADLEKTESSPQQEVPSLVPTTELEKSIDEIVNDQEEINPLGQPLVPTVEMDKTPVQTEQEDLHNGPFAPKDTLTQFPYTSPNNPEGDVNSQIQKESIDEAHSVMESMPVEETQGNIENGKKCEEKPEHLLTVENPPSQEQVPLQSETKQVESTSDLAVNVMSAQELVKVRKRRPARTFVYEEYIYQQVGSTRKRHLHTGETSAKQQPTKKSHHVIEFGPKNKEKKNQKQRKRAQSCKAPKEVVTGSKRFFTNMSEKQVTPKKKGRKSKKDKEVHSSSAENKLAAPVDTQEQQSKENKTNKLKMRKAVGASKVSKEQDDSPALKKIEKVPSTKLINLNIEEICKNVTKETDANTQNTEINMGFINVPVQEITPDPFLLLKGHKQPQLKVYKLDPSKAAGQTQESTQSQEANEGPNMLSTVVRKKAGRPKKNQKAYSLLSSLAVNDPSPKAPCKPKTTRKRKSSLRIETEGVITASHSKRALECKDCGERFNSVSSLQEHKTSMHIVESPGLTFTNGNLFEGVSSLVYQPTKKADGLIGAVSGPSYWDPEAEMRPLDDKECSVSFPALNPSPSLPVTDTVDASGSEDKTGHTSVADISASLDVAKQHTEKFNGTPLGILSSGCSNSETTKMLQSNNIESPSCMSMTIVNGSPQPKGPGAERSLASDLWNPTCQTSVDDGLKRPSHHDSGTEVMFIAEEDVKDDVLLDVDVVTVGEQNEMDQPAFAHNRDSQHDLIGNGNQKGANPDASSIQINNEKTTEVTFLSSSSSTRSLEFKKEQVESMVQKREDSVVRAVGRVSGIRGRGRGRRGNLKRGMLSRRNSDGGNFSRRKAEPDDCQIIFQKCPLTTGSELNKHNDTSVQHSHSSPQSPQLEINQDMLPAACVPSVCSSLVDKRSESGVEEQDKETDQSAIAISERIVTSRLMETADKEQGHLGVGIIQIQTLLIR